MKYEVTKKTVELVDKLVFIEGGKVVTDSLTVAEVFGKRHDNVIRDIASQIVKLHEAGEGSFILLNFEESSYKSERGNFYTKYNLTEEAFTIIAMSYTTPEAMKFKVKFIQEFKRMREELSGPKVLSEREQLIASMKLSLSNSEELTAIKSEVAEIKEQVSNKITLDHGEQQAINHAIKQRVESIFPDFEQNMNKPKLYSQIHSHLRRAFAAPSYRTIKAKDFEEAMAWIRAWRPLL